MSVNDNIYKVTQERLARLYSLVKKQPSNDVAVFILSWDKQ